MSLAKEFGAIGDGQADDTQALQHAVNDGDGVLELSRGTYRITQTITLDLTAGGYRGIRGDQGTSRVIMAGPGPAFEIIGDHNGTASPPSVQPHTWDKERFPVLSGFEIVGAHAEADGVRLKKTHMATLSSVLIRGCRYGIHLVERNRNFILSHSHIYDCLDTGVFFDHVNIHQVNILGNHISYNTRAGIRFLNGDPHNVQITGNDIEYNSGIEGNSAEILLEAPETLISEFTIASNTLQATREAGGANVLILGKEEEVPYSVRLVNITGNVLGARNRNIEIHHGQRISITGNTIYDGTEMNLYLRNCWNSVVGSNTIQSRPAEHQPKTEDGVLFEDCQVIGFIGNVLNDCGYGSEESGGALTLRHCDSIAVNGCQILDYRWRGIHLEDSTRCRISDCDIYERRETPSALASIESTGEGGNHLLSGNRYSEGSRGGILLEESAGTQRDNQPIG
jgi:hypothetical protein